MYYFDGIFVCLASVYFTKLIANPVTGQHPATSATDITTADAHADGLTAKTPAVFLELDLDRSSEGGLVWANISADHYIRGDIELTSYSRIRIKKPGYYFLFSAILFDTYTAVKAPDRPIVAYHGIKLFKFGDEKTIIFNKLTLQTESVLPSHTGPIYHRLEVDDEVEIVVNNIHLIYDSVSNFVNVVYGFSD